jgi:hypothetical protein
MKKIVLGLLVVLISACTDSSVKINTSCEQPSFSISGQVFSWPLSHLESINILNTQSASAEIKFVNDQVPDLSIATLTESQVTGGLSENGYQEFNFTNLNLFFSLLANGKLQSEEIKQLRRVLAIGTHEDVFIDVRDWGFIYTLLNSENGLDAVYLERHQDDRIVMIVTDLVDDDASHLKSFICP